jgi:hypothetical protein
MSCRSSCKGKANPRPPGGLTWRKYADNPACNRHVSALREEFVNDPPDTAFYELKGSKHPTLGLIDEQMNQGYTEVRPVSALIC